MKLQKILDWTDDLLECARFDDVSNNGLQIARSGEEIKKVAFAVDGSVKSIKAAAKARAQLLVVHHGISWGGGIRRLVGGEYNVVKAAMDSNIALAAYHLPLDASYEVGNNWELARHFGLNNVKSAFTYHGSIIGVIGDNEHGQKIGICSGGGGEFAAEAKKLGCDLYITGEANWGNRIAAENVGMKMTCLGHYETETFGVKALMKAMKKALKISTVFVSLLFCLLTCGGGILAAEAEDASSFYLGAAGSLVLPQGGSRLPHLGGAALRGGYYFNDYLALEGETAWMENRAGIAARGVIHWKGWEEWDMLFGFSRFDPFFTLGAKGWLPDGQVGPAAGIGLLYYLTDNWALRAEAEGTLGLDTHAEMVYSLSIGVQYCW